MNRDAAKHAAHSGRTEDESLTHLAQVLAHRLRGLVAGIEGYTDLLADTLVSADQRELAMRILEGTARIETILADLQLYSEAREPTMLPVRVDEVMRDLLAPLSDADAARVEIVIDKNTAGRKLLADPFLVRQAMLVLIQNALDATGTDGWVHVRPARIKSHLCFHVQNDGMIDLDGAEETVFVPFFTTKAQNLGVGLTMARRIAELHEGTLGLTANSDKDGTRFTLSIPEMRQSSLS